MGERRLGILYAINRLLDEIDFENIVINIMGNQNWDGWNYGQMGKILLLYPFISESISFTSYMEEYGLKEMLGKEEWDFDEFSVSRLFQPYWLEILEAVASTLKITEEEAVERKEYLPVRKGYALLISSTRGYPVDVVSQEDAEEAYTVIRFSERNKENRDVQAKLFIGILSSFHADWEEFSEDRNLHTLQTGGKSFLYFSQVTEGLRWIYGLEKVDKLDISSELEDLLIQMKKKAWEMGYDEGLLWLNREFKKTHPVFASLSRKLRLWTKKQNNRVLLQWKPKEESVRYKKKIWAFHTNLSSSHSDAWIIKVMTLRDKWIKNRWLAKMKKRETEVPTIPMLAICWILEQEIFSRSILAGSKESILLDEGISRIKWQGDKVIIPHQASRLITRLFPED